MTGRYSSGAARIQNTVDVVTDAAAGRAALGVSRSPHPRSVAPTEPARDAIASIFYRHTTPSRELTLLDDMVDVSRMTISNTQVRGAASAAGASRNARRLRLARRCTTASFFLPNDDGSAGAGYDIDGRSTRWTPSALWLLFRACRHRGAARRRRRAHGRASRRRDPLRARRNRGQPLNRRRRSRSAMPLRAVNFARSSPSSRTTFLRWDSADKRGRACGARLDPPRHGSSLDHFPRHVRSIQPSCTASNDRRRRVSGSAMP